MNSQDNKTKIFYNKYTHLISRIISLGLPNTYYTEGNNVEHFYNYQKDTANNKSI